MFVVIDALDEYQIGKVSARIALVKDLETLGINLLVTSRNTIPLTEGSFRSLKILSSKDDIHSEPLANWNAQP